MNSDDEEFATPHAEPPSFVQSVHSIANRFHTLWLSGLFVAAVVHAMWLSRGQPAQALGALLFNYIVPLTLAWVTIKSRTATPMDRSLAYLFLILIGLGIIIAPFPALFPNMMIVKRQLPAVQNRIVAWYLMVFLLYLMVILPPYLFAKSLARHGRGESAMFSGPTCVLGFVTWLLACPGFLWLSCVFLGLAKLNR